jgi:hypothetical protein
MSRLTAYRALCSLLGGLFILLGLGSFMAFFRYHAPGGESPAPFIMGPHGLYFVAFTGCALVAWGGCLVGAARRPGAAPWIATASAVGLVMAAVYRMVAWIVGDYAALGDLLRVEAAVMLLAALGLIWLRPLADVSQAYSSAEQEARP